MGEKKETSQEKRKNKKNSKKFVFFVIILLIIIILSVIIINRSRQTEEVTSNEDDSLSYVQEIEAGVKINTSTGINEIRIIDGIQFSNIQLTSSGGMTNLLADVTNVSGESTVLKTLKVILYDENGNELVRMPGVIEELDSGGSTQLIVGASSNYINAYSLEIVFD